MKLNWNFLGEGGCKTKNLPCGGYGYFLKLQIIIYMYLLLLLLILFYCLIIKLNCNTVETFGTETKLEGFLWSTTELIFHPLLNIEGKITEC